jgi:hypothetical protein
VDAAWIGFLGTALGVGVTLLTQWLTGRREREREQARWRREDQRQWLVDRRAAYASLHAALTAWQSEAVSVCWHLRGHVATPEELQDRLDACEERYDGASGLVDLLAPEAVRAASRSASRDWQSFFAMAIREASESFGLTDEQADSSFDRARESTERLLQRMREDLRVVDEAESADVGPLADTTGL